MNLQDDYSFQADRASGGLTIIREDEMHRGEGAWIADPGLAEQGRREIAWAERRMPVLIAD